MLLAALSVVLGLIHYFHPSVMVTFLHFAVLVAFLVSVAVGLFLYLGRPGPITPGHLYGSVGAPEIARGLRAKGLMIEPEMVRMEGGSIKELGLWEVSLHLGFDIETKVKIAIIKAQEKK